MLHFVGFKDSKSDPQYIRAVGLYGQPDFYHRGWDADAFDAVSPGDMVVWANNSPGWQGRSLPPFMHHTF